MPAGGNENQQACERGLVCAPDTKRAQIRRGRSEILCLRPSWDSSRDPQSHTWWPPPGPGSLEKPQRGARHLYFFI